MAMIGGIGPVCPAATYDGARGLATVGHKPACDGSELSWTPRWEVKKRWDVYEGKYEEWEEISDLAEVGHHIGTSHVGGSDFECTACGIKWHDSIHEALNKTYSSEGLFGA
jgi:hypothetical protein